MPDVYVHFRKQEKNDMNAPGLVNSYLNEYQIFSQILSCSLPQIAVHPVNFIQVIII